MHFDTILMLLLSIMIVGNTLGMSQGCWKFVCIDRNELQNWLLTQTYLWILAELGQYAAVHIHSHAETLPLQVLYFWEDKTYIHHSDHSCSSCKLNENHHFNCVYRTGQWSQILWAFIGVCKTQDYKLIYPHSFYGFIVYSYWMSKSIFVNRIVSIYISIENIEACFFNMIKWLVISQ